jgi:hypothetical protein
VERYVENLKNFRERGFDIPSGGAFLLEFYQKRHGTIRVDSSQHVVRLVGPIPVSSLTEECKTYLLRELGLDKSSFAYERLFRYS